MVQVYSTLDTEDPQHAIVLVLPVATSTAATASPRIAPISDGEVTVPTMGSSHAKSRRANAIDRHHSPRYASRHRPTARITAEGGKTTGRRGSRKPRGPVSSPAMQIGVTVQRVDDNLRWKHRSGMRHRVGGDRRVPSLGASSTGDPNVPEKSISSPLSDAVSDATALSPVRNAHPARHRRRFRDHSSARHRFPDDHGYHSRFRELPQSTSPRRPGKIERYARAVPIDSSNPCGALCDSDGESISSITSSDTTERRNHCISPRCQSRTVETSELPTHRSSQCRSSSHHPLMRQLLSPVPTTDRRSSALTPDSVEGGHAVHRRAVQSAGNSTRPHGYAEAAAQCSHWELGHRAEHGDYVSPPPPRSSDPYAARAARAKAKLMERTCKVYYHRDHRDDRPELPISLSARQPDKAGRKKRPERHVERRLDYEEGDVVNHKSHRRKSWDYGDHQRFTQVYHCVTSNPQEGAVIVQMERSKNKMEGSHRRYVSKEHEHERFREYEIERIREWGKKSRERRHKDRELVTRHLRPSTPSRMRPVNSMDSLPPPPPTVKARTSPCVSPTKSEEELLAQTSKVAKASIFMRHGVHVKNRSVRSRNKEGRTVKPMSIKELKALRRKESATQTSDDSEHTGWSDTVKGSTKPNEIPLTEQKNKSQALSKSSKVRTKEEARFLDSRATHRKGKSVRSCTASRVSSNVSERVDNANTLSTTKFAASTASAGTMCSSTSIPHSPSSKHYPTNRQTVSVKAAQDVAEPPVSVGASVVDKKCCSVKERVNSRTSTTSSACHTSVVHASLPGGTSPPSQSLAHLHTPPPPPPPLPSSDTPPASPPRLESSPSTSTNTPPSQPLLPPLDKRFDGDGSSPPPPPPTPPPLTSRPLRRPQGAYVRAVAAEFEENIARNMRADSPPMFLDDRLRVPQGRGGRLAAAGSGGEVAEGDGYDAPSWDTRRSPSPSQHSSGVVSSRCESFRSSEVPTCRVAVRLFERKTTRTMEQMDASVYSFRERRKEAALMRSSTGCHAPEGCDSATGAAGGGSGCHNGIGCCTGNGCCSGGGCCAGGGCSGSGGEGRGEGRACDTTEDASWAEDEPPLPPVPSVQSSPSPSSLPPSMYSPSSPQPSSPSVPSSPPLPFASPGSVPTPRSCDAVASSGDAPPPPQSSCRSASTRATVPRAASRLHRQHQSSPATQRHDLPSGVACTASEPLWKGGDDHSAFSQDPVAFWLENEVYRTYTVTSQDTR